MGYDPNIHHRRSIRLKGYDYSQAGLYFITINIQHRKCLFGTIERREMVVNDFGIIASQEWEKLPEQFTNIALDVFQVMPNHIHGILLLTGAASCPAKTITVGNIVGAYKSQVANLCLTIFKQKHPGEIMGKLWQRNYHEHIVRDEQSFLRIAHYITNNPSNWNEDRFYTDE